MQLLLNEMSLHLGVTPVSHSAFSQRRMQLKHTAFIELNQKAVVEVRRRSSDTSLLLYAKQAKKSCF